MIIYSLSQKKNFFKFIIKIFLSIIFILSLSITFSEAAKKKMKIKIVCTAINMKN